MVNEMGHEELLLARVINMMDDTRRYLLRVRQELNNEDELYPMVKTTINNLERLAVEARDGDPRLVPFAGVFFLKDEESQNFRVRYRAHLAMNKKG